jgi:hypothetical protein
MRAGEQLTGCQQQWWPGVTRGRSEIEAQYLSQQEGVAPQQGRWYLGTARASADRG